MDWRRSSDLADRGYAGAEALKDKLLPLAMDEATFAAFQAARQARRRDVSKGVPEFFTVTGVDAREEAFIRATLAPILGIPLDNDTIVDRILSVTGTEEEPSKAGPSIADIAAGMYAYSSILAALLERNKTGRGQHLDISMLESLVVWMSELCWFISASKGMDDAKPLFVHDA